MAIKKAVFSFHLHIKHMQTGLLKTQSKKKQSQKYAA